MKKIWLFFVVFVVSPAFSQITSWEKSPLNYKNSELNYQNSPLSYNNSPLNYQNSPLNTNSTNGVYDNKGNRIGYETKSNEGVTNLFDNNGNRIGYSPAQQK
jgi:hypothetical protein